MTLVYLCETMNNENKYNCKYCDHIWSRKYDFEQHLKTKKHEKNEKKSREKQEASRKKREMAANLDFDVTGNNLSSDVLSNKKIKTEYCCDYCQFSATNKKEAEKHRKSKQHIRTENKEEDFLEITNKFICVSCDKTYDKYVSCWKHSKTCKGKPIEEIPEETENMSFEIVEKSQAVVVPLQPSVTNIETILEKIADNNTQIMGYIENVIEKMTNVVEKVITSNNSALVQTNSNNTIIQNNTTNNHCTINMFLNEKCKDAVNITDWAHQLQVDYDHLYYTGENGFQKGLTNMLVENLKLCDVYNRPIHFTDVKRDRMYIRDADEWTKHENNDKLIEVLEISARQACIRLTEWMQEHQDVPDYQNLDSELGKQYLALMMSVIRPEAVRLKAYPKVMKELAKTAQLRKEDQV